MKKWKQMILGALIFTPAPSFATPYFRPNNAFYNPPHPQLVTGAMIDPLTLSQTSGSTMFPVLTHSPEDGCILPNVVCESWTPVAIGGALNAGKLTFDAAPIANVLPWVQTAALAVTPAKWTGLVNILTPAGSGSSVTFSAGPVWEYSQRANKGYFKVFTGLQLNF